MLGSELLPGWYDEWVASERERLRQLRLHALDALAERLAAAGRYGEAVETSLAALRTDPLHESTHRALIKTYLAEGNRADAVRHFNSYSRLIERRLGLGPPGDLARLLADATCERAAGPARARPTATP